MQQSVISFSDKGKAVEILANYEPSLHYVSEWWKQLYGESEGKDQKGIYPGIRRSDHRSSFSWVSLSRTARVSCLRLL